MQTAELVDRDGIDREGSDAPRRPTATHPHVLRWVASGISPTTSSIPDLPEANFTFRPEFIDHSLNPLDVLARSTQLYPLAGFELVISGKRFYGWQSHGHCIQKGDLNHRRNKKRVSVNEVSALIAQSGLSPADPPVPHGAADNRGVRGADPRALRSHENCDLMER